MNLNVKMAPLPGSEKHLIYPDRLLAIL